MKKAIYIFSVFLVALSIGTNYVKGQVSFNFDRINLDSYVSGSADTWYYNKVTQKCVKGNPGTVGTKTYTTEQKCKDANNLNTPQIWNQGGTVDPSLSPIFSSPSIQTDPKVTTNTPFVTPQWSQPQGAPSGFQGLSFFPTATTTDKNPAFNFSFNDTETKIFGVTPKENMFLDTKKPDQPAKPGFFTSILNDLGFLSKKDEPKTEPLKDDKPGTSAFQMFGGKTDSINQFDDVTFKQPEKKGTIALLLEKLGIGRSADDVIFKEPEVKPSGSNIPGDKSPILDTTKIDSVTDGDVTVMSDNGTGEPGECGSTREEIQTAINQAIKDNDIKKIEKCVKKWTGTPLYLRIKGSISEEIARALANGKFSNILLDGLTSITSNVAKELSNGSIKTLELKGLTSITSNVAKELSNGNINVLRLDSLTSITSNVAKELSNGSNQYLELNGLTLINSDVAKELSSGRITSLYLNGLTLINSDVAKELSSGRFTRLYLDGLTLITSDVAKELSSGGFTRLYLDSLTSITSDVARILTSGSIKGLVLGSLTSIDPETAVIFAEFEAKGGILYLNKSAREIINSVKDPARNERAAKSACTITAVSLIQKDKDNTEKEITKTGNNFLIELDKDLKIKITLACEADNPIVKDSRLQAYFGSAIKDGKTKTFDTDTKEFTQEFTFTPAELQAQKNIIERPGVLNVKLYDFATKEESSQTRPLGILFDEKTEQELKLCYKIGSEEKCLEGKNANFGHIKASKDKSIDFNWEAKGFDLCWLANPKDLRVELEGTRTMASRQSDFEKFGITCKYTKIDRKEIHQSLMFQIESESKTDDKFNFSIKDNNKDISCKGPVELSWDIGKNWTKCEKIEPTDKTYFESKPWNIESGKKGSIPVNLKENKTDKTQDLVFGIKCYQGDQDAKGEEKRIQVNLSKCETPKERNTAQCTNEANKDPKACEFSVANGYTKTVVLDSRSTPGEGAITGRFNISGCNWPASDQPIYLKARIIIDGREILFPQTGQKIDLSLKRDWEVKFSDIYPEGRKNILGTLWDDKGNPQTYKGREISGAPVSFTIKVDQCIDKNCTQTCSHSEKGDVIQVTYIRKESLPKDTRPKTNTNKEIFILGVTKGEVEIEEFYQYTFSGKLPDGVKEVTCSLFRKQGDGDALKIGGGALSNNPNFEEFKKTLSGTKIRYINPNDVGQWWSQVQCEDANGNTYYSKTIGLKVKEKDAGIQKPLNQHPQEPVTINNVPVLAFHSVNRNEFEAKIKYLKESGYQSMFVSEFFDLCKNNRKLNQKTVVITSDDGYISDYEVFYPVLKEYGMKGVVNIVTSKLTNSADYVSGIQLKDMTGSGIIEAGSHTHNLHNDKLLSSKGETSAVYQNRLKDDFIKSKQILKNVTGKETSVFALPYGRYNKEIAAALKDVGFNKILGSARGLNDASFCTEGTVFKRVTMTDISAKSFKEMVDNNFQ